MKIEYKRAIKRIIRINALTNMSSPIHNKKVVDSVYDYIITNNGSFRWVYQKRIEKKSFCTKCPTILIVLESPHIDEFNNGKPLHPLVNDAKFRKHLFKRLASKGFLNPKSNSIYQVIFVNAIQLQCSLGVPTEYYRDYVFLYYWEKLFKDFENRLTSILNQCNVQLIVNCCTKGSHKKTPYLYNYKTRKYDYMYKTCCKSFTNKLTVNTFGNNLTGYSLQEIVHDSIKKVNQGNLPTIQEPHPSSWH